MINYIKEDHKPSPDMQLKAKQAPNHLEYLCNLDVSSQVGKCKLTSIACVLSKYKITLFRIISFQTEKYF